MVQTGPIRGDFPSLKLGRMVRYGSTIERDLLYFLEYWEHVTWYQEQPLSITHTFPDGHTRRYTPDYEIHKGSIKIIAECKPESRLTSQHTQQQKYIGQDWAAANDYHFMVFTDTQLREGHQLENLKLLWRYARLKAPPSIQNLILMSAGQPPSPKPIIALCHQHNLVLQDVIPVVCHLLFHHWLQMDLDQPFSVATAIWMKQR